jgi:hypothetical protein
VSNKPQKLSQVLVTRLPYAEHYKAEPLLDAAKGIEERSLICISIPIHVENPFGAVELVGQLVNGGLHLVSLVSWLRDRHIVVTKSTRLTSAWEPIAIFSRSRDYVYQKDSIRKIKKGFEGKELTFDEDAFLTCQTDHWVIANDRRDRRFLPAQVVLNCGQLAGMKPGDTLLDPYGSPSIREATKVLGWEYRDLGYPSAIRAVRKKFTENEE